MRNKIQLGIVNPYMPRKYKERNKHKSYERYWNNEDKYKQMMKDNYERTRTRFHCSTCNIYCNNNSKFKRHLATKKHKRNADPQSTNSWYNSKKYR